MLSVRHLSEYALFTNFERVGVVATEESVRKNLDEGKYEPYLRHIRFPRFKSLADGTRIDFTFPITAIVGPNGTNKSSVLRAIQGCPDYENIGNYWFATNLDPINDDERHRFIHGYRTASGQLVESIKTRVAKANNPDYWEPSRPLLTGFDSMKRMPTAEETHSDDQILRTKTRWKAVRKEVVYLDFRHHIAAFDLFYRLDAGNRKRDRKAKKEFLRHRAVHLKSAMDSRTSFYSYYGSNRVDAPCVELDESQVEWISRILGRKYKSIRLIRHSFYEISGYTVGLTSSTLQYSEAFAGSGEYAVVLLVKAVIEAPRASLIVLDEPEVSLHPAAQRELMRFLEIMSVMKRHQMVLATHSPTMIHTLPADAIKMISLDPATGRSQITAQETFRADAFHRLGATVDTPQILVEDRLAAVIVRANLAHLQVDTNTVDVVALGGAEKIKSRDIPALVRQKSRSLVLLDGDQKPTEPLKDPSQLTAQSLLLQLERIVPRKSDLGLDGGIASNQDQHLEHAAQISSWAIDFLRYLPLNTPEELLLEVPGEKLEPTQTPKGYWVDLARRTLCNAERREPSADDILYSQRFALNHMSLDHPLFCELQQVLREYLERRG